MVGKHIKAFPNIGNSCYMDCVIFCLFATPNEFVQKQILKSRKSFVECSSNNINKLFFKQLKSTLADLHTSLMSGHDDSDRKKNSCTSLKALIRKFRPECAWMTTTYPNFGNSSQQEALEFLQFIFSPFGLNGTKDCGNHLQTTKRYGVAYSKTQIEWLPWFNRIDKRSSIIFFVNHDIFKESKKSIGKFIKPSQINLGLENTKYKKCIVNASHEKQEFIHFSDLVVIAIDRINPVTNQVLHNPVKIDKSIVSSSSKSLHLDSVIVHLGETKTSGHYICFKKCDRKWLLYDDLMEDVVNIGSWTKVLKYRNGLVEKNGVLFFYTVQY